MEEIVEEETEDMVVVGLGNLARVTSLKWFVGFGVVRERKGFGVVRLAEPAAAVAVRAISGDIFVYCDRQTVDDDG